METNSDAYLDPEEDEIFFYEINDRESELKGLFENEPTLLNVTKSYDEHEKGNDSEKERTNSKEETINLLNTDINLEESLDLSYCGIADLNNWEVTKEEKKNTELSEVHISTENKNMNLNHEKSRSKININFNDHHTTPSKNIFDRNILRTPKSIVKADKDGGYLKVLSEIALVKAEADENLYKDSQKLEIQDHKENLYLQNVKQDSFCQEAKQHLFNDENKENRHFDSKLDIPLINLIEATPIKSYQSPASAKINFESNTSKQYVDIKKSKSSETLNDYDSDLSLNDYLKSFGKFIKEESLVSENKSNIMSNVEALIEFDDESYQTQVAASNERSFDDSVNLIFDKEDNDCSVQDKSDDELIIKKLSDDMNSLRINDSYSKLSDEDDKSKEENFALQQNLNENACVENKSLDLQVKEKETCLNDNLRISDDLDNSCSNNQHFFAFKDEESRKNWLKRNTKRLWEELNEAAYSEKTEKKFNGSKLTFRLSEEARKVIEVIKAVGIDDSINSSDQFFDLDKINNSFLVNEKSDVFNETLTKPVNSFTKKDFELLQEKITSNIFDSLKLEANSEKKQTLLHGKVAESVKLNQGLPKETPQKIHLIKSNDLKKSENLITPKQNNFDKQEFMQSSTKQIVPNVTDLSGNKASLLNTQNQARYICQNRLRGCQTNERNMKLKGSTKIPRLASTTSKISISERSGKTETGKRTPKLNSLSKVQKSLKFNNIESPVQAYINSKASVLVSNVKPKSEPAFNMWMKHVNTNIKNTVTVNKEMTNKKPVNKPTSDLPFVEFKSAIPLIVEKPAKSRLPRLAPTMKKLVGSNSPVIAKHKGRIQLNICDRSQKCESGCSANANPTEVSVLYSKVAQVTNVKN